MPPQLLNEYRRIRLLTGTGVAWAVERSRYTANTHRVTAQ